MSLISRLRFRRRAAAEQALDVPYTEAPEFQNATILPTTDWRIHCGPIQDQNVPPEGCCTAESGGSDREFDCRRAGQGTPVFS